MPHRACSASGKPQPGLCTPRVGARPAGSRPPARAQPDPISRAWTKSEPRLTSNTHRHTFSAFFSSMRKCLLVISGSRLEVVIGVLLQSRLRQGRLFLQLLVCPRGELAGSGGAPNIEPGILGAWPYAGIQVYPRPRNAAAGAGNKGPTCIEPTNGPPAAAKRDQIYGCASEFLAFVLLTPDQKMVGCRGGQQSFGRALFLFSPRAITRDGQVPGPTLVEARVSGRKRAAESKCRRPSAG